MKFNNLGDNLICAISNRKDGSMRLHGVELLDRDARANRFAYLSSLRANPMRTVYAGLVHGNKVAVVSRPLSKNLLTEKLWNNYTMPGIDALVTGDKGVCLALTNADCFSVYLYDPVQKAIGLMHCGWKSILAGVIENTVKALRENYNSSPEHIRVLIGPGIRSCHFEVKKDVAQKFEGYYKFKKKYVPIIPQPTDPKADTWEHVDSWWVDLEAAIKFRLVNRGVLPENVESVKHCTFCYKALTELKQLPEKSVFEYQYHSFRREKSDPLKTQLAVFGMV